MLTSDNFSLQESFNDSDITDLKNKISNNEKTIKEFESHLRSLLTIAKETELDYSFQIQKGLEKIKYLVEDNVTSKRLLLKEYKKGEELEEKLARYPIKLLKGEKLISVIFTSEDQKFQHSIISKNTEKLGKLVEQLYNDYPEYLESESQNYFISNGNKVSLFKSLDENNIHNSDVIILNKLDI